MVVQRLLHAQVELRHASCWPETKRGQQTSPRAPPRGHHGGARPAAHASSGRAACLWNRTVHAANGRRRVACSSTAAPPAGQGSAAPRSHDGLELANNCVPMPGLTLPAAVQAPTPSGEVLASAAAAAAAAMGSSVAVAAPAGEAGEHHAPLHASQDEIDQYVHNILEHELESINQAVHAAMEQEMGQVNQTVQEAVESALLDRSFDIKANLNTLVALTATILYWRGMWNLFDSWLGTDNVTANAVSVVIGFSVMLAFRILKIPVAEFW